MGVGPVAVGDRGHDGQGQNRQLPGGAEGHQHAAHQEQHVGQQVVHEGVQRLRHLAGVVGESTGELARMHGVEEGDVHADDAGEELQPHRARHPPLHQLLRQRLQPAEAALQHIHHHVRQHRRLEAASPRLWVLQKGDDAVEDGALHIGCQDLQQLHNHQACQSRHQRGPEVQGDEDNTLEVSPCCNLLASPPHRPSTKSLGTGFVFLFIASGAKAKIAAAANVGHVVRPLHRIATNGAAMTLQLGLKEQWVHMHMRDELTLVLSELIEHILQHEVFHVDHDHGDGLQSAL
mmetsp:Transcript_74349/g.177356  ORF Transcript_74349/g.177356 Transcript_74349/m.177356 type:complete len:291 (-) Transcript_74349:590-1462(-)